MAGKKWGRREPGSPAWERRYERLRKEGFVHEEAARLASGKIGSSAMRRGRRARIQWFRDILKTNPNMTKKELETAVDDMYDTYDWYDPYSQFYPEGGNVEA